MFIVFTTTPSPLPLKSSNSGVYYALIAALTPPSNHANLIARAFPLFPPKQLLPSASRLPHFEPAPSLL